METRSNYILVGVVTLALLLAAVGFTVWLARFNDGAQKEYDIFFKQSVNGLAKGSGVSFAGVPSGQITEIKLWKDDPEFVRVRISIDDSVPILQGTVATIAGVGFTGVSEIQLDGAVKGAPAISCPKVKPESACPGGVPVIPTKPGALGELLNSAPLLLERLSTLTERLTNIMSDKNQQSIQQILDNVEGLSGSLASQAPEMRAVIQESRITLQKAGQASEQIALVAQSTGSMIDSEGKATFAELRSTLNAANKSLAALEQVANKSGPVLDQVAVQTIPEVNKLTRDLQKLTNSLKSISDKLEQDGASSLIGTPALPDYDPKKGK
ncbi:MlaD family protein [Sphingorhabdus arenilitoris]|uniref:MlaD family protein n=1 Tax=Sphingorhabdus arenilitoris TaxID=1490041 RepID=A0ABV8RE83_9SPHN